MGDELSEERVEALEQRLRSDREFYANNYPDAEDIRELALIDTTLALIKDWRERGEAIEAYSARLQTPPDRTRICRSCGDIGAHLALARENALKAEIERLKIAVPLGAVAISAGMYQRLMDVAKSAEEYVEAGGFVRKSQATPRRVYAQERWFEKEEALADALAALRGTK